MANSSISCGWSAICASRKWCNFDCHGTQFHVPLPPLTAHKPPDYMYFIRRQLNWTKFRRRLIMKCLMEKKNMLLNSKFLHYYLMLYNYKYVVLIHTVKVCIIMCLVCSIQSRKELVNSLAKPPVYIGMSFSHCLCTFVSNILI